jgi:hypothetical protein
VSADGPQLPSRAELLDLAQVAEQRMLTPREAHELRVGLVFLDAELTKATSKAQQLTAALALAAKERDDAQLALALSGGRSVKCRYCGEPAARPCRDAAGRVMEKPHTARLTDAERRSWARREAA